MKKEGKSNIIVFVPAKKQTKSPLVNK